MLGPSGVMGPRYVAPCFWGKRHGFSMLWWSVLVVYSQNPSHVLVEGLLALQPSQLITVTID